MRRRTFLRSSLAGAALLAVPDILLADDNPKPIADTSNSTIKRPAEKEPFHLGMAGYTFCNFDIDKTLETMKRLDVHYLCIKDFHLPLNSSKEQVEAFKAKLASAGVTGYGAGPIYMRNLKEVDQAFDYAKLIGIDLIVAVPGQWGDKGPNPQVMDRIEEKIKETGIRIAFHLHGPDMDMFPNAESVWEAVKDRDPRMGMCLDIGHNLRYGSDSLHDYIRYHSRVFDIHMKDVTGSKKANGAIELGRGVIDFPEFVRLLRKYNYTGSVSLEYEKDMKDPFMGIAESVGYFRAVCYCTK